MLDSWSVYLTFTEWCHVGIVTYVSDIIQNDVGLVICVSDIIHDDAMLDSWSVYLTLYMMTQCWTRDLCIWHYTWWRNVGLVICVSGIIQNDVGLVICASDIIQNDAMLDSWSVYLTLYRMTPCWTSDLYLTLYRMTPCWTRDMCIWHYTWWCNVGLMICVSDILQNDAMLDSWSVYLT